MSQNKLKVMIVDDEELSRKFIMSSLDWEAYDLQIIAEASSVLEALSLLEEETPDILFTDIRMPYMDGLELSQLVLEKYPYIKVVILTAFKDFDYAQKSIRIGVSHFLLKPVNKLELQVTVEKLRAQIEEERRRYSELDHLRQILNNNYTFLREQFLLEFLDNSSSISPHQLRYYYPEGIPTYIQVTLLQMPVAHIQETSEEELLLQDMKNLEYVKEFLTGKEQIEALIDHSHHLIIISYSSDIQLLSLCEQIQSSIKTMSGNDILFGIGNVYSDFQQIKRSYQEGLESLKLSQYASAQSITIYQDDINVGNNDWHSKQNHLEDLRFYIKAGLSDPLNEILPMLYLDSENQPLDLEHTRILSMTLLSSALNVALDIGVPVSELFEGGSSDLIPILSLPSVTDMRVKTIGCLEKITTSIAAYRTNRSKSALWDILQHIQKEMANPGLTLTSVAKKFYMNDSYLSRTFKKELGFSFSKYLNRIRMEKAISLISESNMKAYQIAEIVGIPDAYYFSNCFKKYTGKSIRDFKKGL